MPRSSPHPLALFSLAACNNRTTAVVNHPRNSHLVSILEGSLVIDIGHIRKPDFTLATFGRNGDVFVEGSSIAKVQCSIEINPDSNVVMLYDRSHSQTTQLHGPDAIRFESGRPRKVVLQPSVNTQFGMGGASGDLILFRVKWDGPATLAMQKLKNRQISLQNYEQDPLLARTIMDEAETVRMTRIHTLRANELKIRYAKLAILGAGTYGTVHSVVDVDSGKLMAIKLIQLSPMDDEKAQKVIYSSLKREVEALSRISHPHIVDYIASQLNCHEIAIFMGLKEGDLVSLAKSGFQIPADDLLHHMLQALDYLTSIDIIHRDVKPPNILYKVDPNGKMIFQLGDFGLCNYATTAITHAGTPHFMAPEMYQNGAQTFKVDIWSLFVTMAWTLDAGEFRQRRHECKTPGETHEMIINIASHDDRLLTIREMATIEPEYRPSAAQLLVKLFKGSGLSTPFHLVPR